MVWADLASGPPFRRNAEIGSCNRGLSSPKTYTFFLFNQNYAQPLHFLWKTLTSSGVASKKNNINWDQ
jgi:hypothetical protein